MPSIERGPESRVMSWTCTALFIASLVACGGGGGSDSPAPADTSSAAYAQQCVSPRAAGTLDPQTGNPYGDIQGSIATEKSWVRAWIDETYLWYDEVPNADPANYSDAVAYFGVLKTGAVTASGKPKDAYHFTYDTPSWVAQSQLGANVGYGFEFSALAGTPPRQYLIAYVDPGSPAQLQGVARGAELLTVDGVDFVNSDTVDVINAGLFPTATGQTHNFTFRNPDGLTTRSVTLSSSTINTVPVQNTRTFGTASGNVGYVQFNDHVATAEAGMIAAVEQLLGNGSVSDLILDIRYNGGGYLDIASEVAYMVAGPSTTAGQPFERIDFNAKNPFDFSLADRTTPFWTTTQGLPGATLPAGQTLPTLGLSRVFVLTGPDTCSASEAIINGLRGVGVQVIQIGETTCGKPYGFFPTDNCNTTYFSIQFKGVNAVGYGDYADGFVPNGTGDSGIPGCVVADDFAHPLGDASEARIAAALSYQATGSCTAGLRASSSSLRPAAASLKTAHLVRSPMRENRFYRPR